MKLLQGVGQFPTADDDSVIYGAPYETADGSTVITVAQIGGLLRRTARPLGVFVIHDGKAQWAPAVDATRIAVTGEMIGLLSAVIFTLAILRRPPWPDLSRRGGHEHWTRPRRARRGR